MKAILHILVVLTIIVGIFWGWLFAHHDIANECKKLGKFYVGEEVFECKVIKNES